MGTKGGSALSSVACAPLQRRRCANHMLLLATMPLAASPGALQLQLFSYACQLEARARTYRPAATTPLLRRYCTLLPPPPPPPLLLQHTKQRQTAAAVAAARRRAHLRVDVLVRPEHRQARALGRAADL